MERLIKFFTQNLMDVGFFFIIIVAEPMTSGKLGDTHRVLVAFHILKSERSRKTTVVQTENTEI